MPSVIIAAMFVVFSLTASLLSFDIRPLSQAMGATYTGRVETLWSMVRVLSILLGLLTYYVPPLLVAVVMLLAASVLFYVHLLALPFLGLVENVFRGGIYCAVCWLALANLVVAALSQTGNWSAATPFWAVPFQWTLIAATPLFFLLGMALVWLRRSRVLKAAGRLRATWEAGLSQQDEEPGAQQHKTPGLLPGRGVSDGFFDAGRRRNCFQDGQAALLVVRTVLSGRDKKDFPFLAHLVQVRSCRQGAPCCFQCILTFRSWYDPYIQIMVSEQFHKHEFYMRRTGLNYP